MDHIGTVVSNSFTQLHSPLHSFERHHFLSQELEILLTMVELNDTIEWTDRDLPSFNDDTFWQGLGLQTASFWPDSFAIPPQSGNHDVLPRTADEDLWYYALPAATEPDGIESFLPGPGHDQNEDQTRPWTNRKSDPIPVKTHRGFPTVSLNTSASLNSFESSSRGTASLSLPSFESYIEDLGSLKTVIPECGCTETLDPSVFRSRYNCSPPTFTKSSLTKLLEEFDSITTTTIDPSQVSLDCQNPPSEHTQMLDHRTELHQDSPELTTDPAQQFLASDCSWADRDEMGDLQPFTEEPLALVRKESRELPRLPNQLLLADRLQVNSMAQLTGSRYEEIDEGEWRRAPLTMSESLVSRSHGSWDSEQERWPSERIDPTFKRRKAASLASLREITCGHTSPALLTSQSCPSRTYEKKTRLKRHPLIANGYHCQYPDCEKKFNRAGDCRKHETVHDSVRPHRCLVCDRTFMYPKDLRRHVSRKKHD